MRFYALPNASVGHKNIFTVIIRYMKGGNRLSNVRVTGDQTAEVLVLARKKELLHAQIFKVVQIVEYSTRQPTESKKIYIRDIEAKVH